MVTGNVSPSWILLHRITCALQGILYNYIGCYTYFSATYDVNGWFFAVNGKISTKKPQSSDFDQITVGITPRTNFAFQQSDAILFYFVLSVFPSLIFSLIMSHMTIWNDITQGKIWGKAQVGKLQCFQGLAGLHITACGILWRFINGGISTWNFVFLIISYDSYTSNSNTAPDILTIRCCVLYF